MDTHIRTIDKAVARLRAQTLGAYRAPKVIYTCKLCPRGRFKTTALPDAWAHTLKHGPWPELGYLAETHVLNLAALTARNGTGSRGHV